MASKQSPRTRRPAPGGLDASTEPTRSGKVALVGRPNVGKSTLLNAALDHPLAIISSTPQTTRDALLGVVHHGGAEIGLLDTPGLHKPKTALGRAMNASARDAARDADVVAFVIEVPRKPTSRGPKRPVRAKAPPAGEATPTGPRPLAPHPGDLALLADLGTDVPVVLVVNKVDRLKDKTELFPLLEAYGSVRDFAAVVPISAIRTNGVERVLEEVARLCPEGEWRYPPDELTDRPTKYFAAEYVREQILKATEAEVPHAAAVEIERYAEPTGPGKIRIDATIHVERAGQKKILVGRGGEMLKQIGTRARLRIEELVGAPIHLQLFVRVTPGWRESPRQLEELGYGARRGES